MTTDHAEQLGQQITRAWQRVCEASLDGREDEARLAYAQIDRLLERLPRPREAMDDAVVDEPTARQRD
jgi:hypothetical protein